MRYVMFPHGKHVAWCSDTGKSCRVSARHCEGAFIREDKIKKTLKEWEMLYGPEGVDYEQK
jgi:hypothetical protein